MTLTSCNPHLITLIRTLPRTNCFSTHPRGEALGGVTENTLVLYPMKHPSRQRERRPELINYLHHLGRYARTLDLSVTEQAIAPTTVDDDDDDGHHHHRTIPLPPSSTPRYFEGTGVLVLDRVRGVAYVALSERADADIARAWGQALGYPEVITFVATNAGKPVYHTNVLLAVGTGCAVVCSESVADATERRDLLAALGRHHAVVDVTITQMEKLCGNVLEVRNRNGLPVWAMSTQAYQAFTEQQRHVLLQYAAGIHHVSIDTLEHLGGGWVRCTLAEIF